MANRPNISVRELARRLDVSTATVSRALNNHPEVSEETRTRVLELADQTGYQPRIGQRFHRLVGLVYPSQPVRPDFGSFESAVMAGVLRGLAEEKYDLTLLDVGRDLMQGETLTQFFRRKHVRGVIVRTVSPTPELAERIAAESFPHVMIADRSDDPAVNFVCADSGEDSFRAVEHLVHLGHRRIATVVHTVPDSDHEDRVRGYIKCLSEYGLPSDPAVMLSIRAGLSGGAVAIDRILSMPEPPTAVYITDPLTTVGALHRCLERGVRVPGDLSVVGFDDSDVRLRTFPRYTAVCQDAEGYAYDAARWLTKTLEGSETGRLRSRRPTKLSFHESTGVISKEQTVEGGGVWGSSRRVADFAEVRAPVRAL